MQSLDRTDQRTMFITAGFREPEQGEITHAKLACTDLKPPPNFLFKPRPHLASKQFRPKLCVQKKASEGKNGREIF